MRISLHPFRVWNGGARLVKFAWNSQVRRVSIDSPPTFLVGNQHSGTSVSLAVLGAHSRIHAIPYETKLLEKNSELWFRTGIKISISERSRLVSSDGSKKLQITF